ncbi:HNH endonuclease [Paraglaciecola chathamensis]|uniref:HNH endonuclease n=1 Tax=Paraglaciecola chathamensis TaxID=368405 RepID=UPI00270CBA34|nr:HNH endonuclease [Paraglaciecola chathamensis]MDO6838256.1 HNH endonuclease [Paraglaciecola chathamensis]
MPNRPGKACRKTGCPNIATHTQHQGYCEQHKDSAGWYANERAKGNRHQRGYGKDWQQLREIVLQRDKAICQAHKRQGQIVSGNHVDHIKPKSMGGTDSLTNLEVLCSRCHNEKTANERTRGTGVF